MKVNRLLVKNFRNIQEGTFYFDNHTLFIGTNNVGKSTICEALDLVLGPDRLNASPPLNEFDFYNAKYLGDDKLTQVPITVEVILTSLSDEIKNKVSSHIEYWHSLENRLLDSGELDLTNDPKVIPCLRLVTIGLYNLEEDEFEAQTYFSYSPFEDEGNLKTVSRSLKRQFGFIYLRTLRTGSRALSLERGSLLDVILRIANVRTGLWETSITRLRTLDPPIDKNAENLRTVLDGIEKRIAQYIQINSTASTSLFVSNLTREHLRKTISFFLSVSQDQVPVPFQEVGTGTLNTLVLALLSFIAEMKEEVIFAMEEPEIALPPHTQRRIASYLLEKTNQCFVTSHSPYIIEMFNPDQILILRRDNTNGTLSCSKVEIGQDTIKLKNFRKHSRRALCEVMLGKGVIVVEGLTEQSVFWAISRKMEEAKDDFYPLDLSGVTIFSNDGDGSMPDFGRFFKSIDLKTYGFFDGKKNKYRDEDQKIKLHAAFDVSKEIMFTGIEQLLITEIPTDRQWEFLTDLRDAGEKENANIPGAKPLDDEIKELTLKILKASKGDGSAGRLIECCQLKDLPITIVDFFKQVYTDFPKPKSIPVPKFETIEGQQKLNL
jgi:putative ATP-dependent endonuclease of OLD family